MLDDSLPTAAAARMDALCLEFESLLKEGRCPDIDSYVQKAEPDDQELLRRELQRIWAEFERLSGSRPEVPPNDRSSPTKSTDRFHTTPSNTEPPCELSQTDAYLASSSDSAGNPATAVTSFDRYEVRSVLGKGGFAVVYHGYDPELHREVAIKAPFRSPPASHFQTETYIEEARMVAGLDHPGIVPVYDVGRKNDGQCFVISKYVGGGDLAKWMAQQRPSARRAAEVVAEVADALQHAHQQGLVHRDIKPGNILIDDDGRPLLADFGLALGDDSFGRGPARCGTPAYMSPEQAGGESHRVDARSDIYSLGVVFYELLTGRRPYRHTQVDDVMDEITSGEIRPPRQLDPTIPLELERICLKALARDVSQRYTTAFDLAEDLRRFLNGSHPQLANDRPAAEIRLAPRGGWRKGGFGLAASLLAICCVVFTVGVPWREKPVARFDALELKVAPVQENRSLDEQQATHSLINGGVNVADSLDDRLDPEEAFQLEGSFAVPCFWRLLWFDTRGRWSMDEAPDKEQEAFFYPLNRTMVPVDPDDPPGTHLLIIVAGDKPIGEQLRKHLEERKMSPPPSLERPVFRSNSETATSRGAGRQVETIDSYLESIAGQLPKDQKLVAALFLPVGRAP